MKRRVLFLLAVLAWPAWLIAQEEATDDAPESRSVVSGADQLVEEKSRFKMTWVHPDADFSQYDKLYIWEGIFEFRDVGPAKRSRSRMVMSHEQAFGILESDQERFKQVVGDSFMKEIEKSKRFSVVDTLGPNTLFVRGAVLDIVSRVPPDFTGTSDIYLATSGEATLIIDLIDAETGVIQARVAERRAIQPPGGGRIDVFSQPTNSVTVWSDVSRWARSAAARLRKELETAQKADA
jgi:hypothetical protein